MHSTHPTPTHSQLLPRECFSAPTRPSSTQPLGTLPEAKARELLPAFGPNLKAPAESLPPLPQWFRWAAGGGMQGAAVWHAARQAAAA